jgi:transposase
MDRNGQLDLLEATPTGQLIAGVKRLEAASRLGWEELKVWVRGDLWTSPRTVDTQLRGYNHPGRSIMTKKRRTYTPEFKTEAVKLVTEQGYSVAEAARSLGIHETLLRSWKQTLEAQGDQAFPGHGKLPAIEEELRRLHAENKRLRAERDILKKATALFALEAM